MNEDQEALDHFGGIARLFPLPNFVLFPNVLAPLHVFEPRYRELTRDALAGDRLIAMVMLKPGWEPHYEGQPDLHAVGCLARIVTEQQMADGRFNLLLRGLCRLQLDGEVYNLKQYRSARSHILRDGPPVDLPALRALVVEAASHWLPQKGQVVSQFRSMLESDIPLGALCDLVAFVLPLAADAKQELLAETDIERRVKRLIVALQGSPPETLPPPRPIRPQKFPPEFSVN